MQNVSSELKEKYDSFYVDSLEQWRHEGARKKVDNICKIVNGQKFSSLIEIGAGEGSILSILDQTDISKELYALEISTSGIEKINSRKIQKLKEVKLFDGYTIPYADKQFDLAICSHVIEHVEHPRLLLREIKRISKQQVFEIPIDFSSKLDKKVNHFISYGHINIYTPSLFRFLLLSENFNIRKSIAGMYSVKTLQLVKANSKLKFLILLFKRMIWFLVPKLLKNNPDTYTVLTV
jgi:ubiquinone/menaquinone biosynthesis C-methylase UbiE